MVCVLAQGDRREPKIREERRVRESFFMKTEDGEKRKEVCRGDTS